MILTTERLTLSAFTEADWSFFLTLRQSPDVMRDYAFTQTHVTALNAWVLAANQGSVRLLEKLGFTRTQVLEKGYTINGVDYDDWAYRLEKTR